MNQRNAKYWWSVFILYILFSMTIYTTGALTATWIFNLDFITSFLLVGTILFFMNFIIKGFNRTVKNVLPFNRLKNKLKNKQKQKM